MIARGICLVLFLAVIAGLSMCGTGCAWLKSNTPEPVQAAAKDCADAEIKHAIQDLVCGRIDPPKEIAARVAECMVDKTVEHMFGAGNVCLGYVRDAGAER